MTITFPDLGLNGNLVSGPFKFIFEYPCCRACLLPAKEETEGSDPPKLKEAAVKAWKSITKEECKSFVMSMGHRLDAVIESKGFATKY